MEFTKAFQIVGNKEVFESSLFLREECSFFRCTPAAIPQDQVWISVTTAAEPVQLPFQKEKPHSQKQVSAKRKFFSNAHAQIKKSRGARD